MARKMTRKNVALMFERLAEHAPSPKTELYYKDPFTLVVAVALSAQATDEGVNKATKVLFEIADTPAKMAALGEEKLGAFIKTIGLWRNKAKNVIALSKMILDDFDGEVPQTREELEKLPGVGRKTANVVMNVAFGAPTIAVDTHIFRVCNRTGAAPGKTPLEVEKGLEKVVPEIYRQDAHHWLILHGRYVCTAMKAPDCPNCEVVDLCLYKDKIQPGEPKKTKRSTKKKLAAKPKLRETTKKINRKTKSA